MVLGATNRYVDIDKAILRRMPKRFPIALPDEDQRYKILSLLLKDTAVQEPRDALLRRLASACEGLSGSDMKELCRNAAMLPVRYDYFLLIDFLGSICGD